MSRQKPSKPEPEVLELQLPEGKLKAVGGAQLDQWNEWLVTIFPGAMPTRYSTSTEVSKMTSVGAMAGLVEMKPTDPAEAAVIMQIIAANASATELYRRAWHPEQTFEARCRFLALADKAARTVGILADTLDRRRRGGQQHVTVKHVTVNADQAVVTDTVMTGAAGGARDKNGGQPHALAHAPVAALFGEIEAEPDSVPRTGGGGV